MRYRIFSIERDAVSVRDVCFGEHVARGRGTTCSRPQKEGAIHKRKRRYSNNVVIETSYYLATITMLGLMERVVNSLWIRFLSFPIMYSLIHQFLKLRILLCFL